MNLKRLNIEIEGPADDVKRKRNSILPVLGQRFYVMAASHQNYLDFLREINCTPVVGRFISDPNQVRGIENVTVVRLPGYQRHPEYANITEVLVMRKGLTVINFDKW